MAEGCRDDSTNVCAIDSHTGALPEICQKPRYTQPHVAPRPNPQQRPLTCAVVWGRVVLHGVVNPRRIDGKDGIAALSKGIPSGCVYSGGPDIWRRHGAVGSASVSRSRWHQVIAALTARCACRGLSPAGVLAWPCPEPWPRLRSSATPTAIDDNPAEDLLDRIGTIRSGKYRGRMQLQRLLGRLHKLGNLGIDSNRQAAFGQHDLGGCLHELLGRANRASRIVWQGAPDALQLSADPRWVGETGQSGLKCG